MCPHKSFAASLTLVPGGGVYHVGDTFTVSFLVQSPTQAINAVAGTVSYDTNLLEVVTLSKVSSVISLWVKEPTFSNTVGNLSFEGITLNPGFIGQNGKIISATFKVKATGTATLTYTNGSILANDGNGTELFTELGRGTYTFSSASVVLQKPAEEVADVKKNIPATPAISLSHVSEIGWLSSTTAHFKFTLTSDVIALRLLLDDTPESTPVVVYEPPIASRTITDIKEGTSYLHVQYQNRNGWGEILHFKIQVDTTAPLAPLVTEVSPGVFTIEADDQDSGIVYYDIAVDNQTAVQYVDGGDHRYVVPEQKEGIHTLRVIAFDAAGNSAPTSVAFETKGTSELKTETPNAPDKTENHIGFIRMSTAIIAVLSVIIPLFALVITLGLLLFVVWRAFGGLRRRIDREVFEAKATVQQSFMLIRHDLEEDIKTLEKASKKRKLTREEAKILKRLRENLNAAEQLILKEVVDIEMEINAK